MRILLTGASGQLGPYIVRRLLREGHDLTLWSQSWPQPVFGVPVRQVDIADFAQAGRAFAEAAPQVVIHAAAISNMQQALTDPMLAERVNVYGTAGLCELAAHHRARMIYFSTDLVFDGEQEVRATRIGYTENDATRPLSCYAQTKLMGEGPVRLKEHNLIFRLPLVIGPSLTTRLKFFDHLLAALRDKRKITLFDDEWRTPIAPDVVADAVALAIDSGIAGTFHLAGPDRLSRHEIGLRLARFMGLDPSPIIAASRLSIESTEPRPRDTSLDASTWYAAMPQCPRPTFEESMKP